MSVPFREVFLCRNYCNQDNICHQECKCSRIQNCHKRNTSSVSFLFSAFDAEPQDWLSSDVVLVARLIQCANVLAVIAILDFVFSDYFSINQCPTDHFINVDDLSNGAHLIASTIIRIPRTHSVITRIRINRFFVILVASTVHQIQACTKPVDTALP